MENNVMFEQGKQKESKWLIVYSYKEYMDFYLEDSYENALRQTNCLIAGWLYDIEDEQMKKNLANLIQRDLWKDALETWNDFKAIDRGEFLSIIELPIVDRVLNPIKKPDLSSYLEDN